MENIVLVVKAVSFLACAKTSEVLSCLWYLLCKELKHHSAFLCLIAFANLQIEENLRVVFSESWQLVKYISDFDCLLLIVYSLTEEFFHSLLLRSAVLLFFILELFKLIS